MVPETRAYRMLRRALWHVIEKRRSRRAWLWLRDVLHAMLANVEPPEIPKVGDKDHPLPPHPEE